jgi:hypothetical protein
MALTSSSDIRWQDLVAEALVELGGEGHLSAINALLEGHPKTLTNPTWQATIRRVVRQYSVFEPVGEGKGVYRLVMPSRPTPEVTEVNSADPVVGHAEVQGMLVHLGHLCGYETYVPKADQTTRQFQGQPLRDLVTVRDCSAVFRGPNARANALVDVLWFADDDEGLFPAYAFEVEHTTDVKSGLLRLAGLPRRYTVPLYIVAAERERPRFERFVASDPFRQMSDRLRFQAYDRLAEVYNTAVRHEQLLSEFGLAPRR